MGLEICPSRIRSVIPIASVPIGKMNWKDGSVDCLCFRLCRFFRQRHRYISEKDLKDIDICHVLVS